MNIVRADDRAFVRYLTRGLAEPRASEIALALLEALGGGCLLLRDPGKFSDELRLILRLYSGQLSCRAEQLAPHLSAFRATLQDGLPGIARLHGPTWDKRFGRLYREYLKTPCAGYRVLTEDVIRSLTRSWGGQLRILDLGCGGGDLLDSALPVDRQAMEVIGVDYEANAAAEFLRRFPNGHIYQCGIDRAFADERFLSRIDGSDIALASMSLHHLPRNLKQTVIAEVYRSLRPGGVLILNELYGGFEGLPRGSFPLVFNVVKYYALESRMLYDHLVNQGRPPSQVCRFLEEFFGKEILRLLAAQTTEGEEKCIYPEEWVDLVRGQGFQIIPFSHGVVLDPACVDRGEAFIVTCAFSDGSLPCDPIPLLYSLIGQRPLGGHPSRQGHATRLATSYSGRI